jgi:uncharacterized membrane protein
VAARNALAWKAAYGLISLVGIVMLARGYGELRATSMWLYVPPVWTRHLAALLLLPTFVFFLAPYFPGKIKTALEHPQLVAVKLWATAHLLANGRLIDVVLFGSFLIWAVADRISMKRRAQRPVPGAPASAVNDVILVVVGLGLYAAMVLWWHVAWFGVAPLPFG